VPPDALSPSNSIQQLTARNGGSTSATAAAANAAVRRRPSSVASQSAAKNPAPTAPAVAAPLTSKLLKIKCQFMIFPRRIQRRLFALRWRNWRKKKPFQPVNQNIRLRDIGIEKLGGDGCAERSARFLLPGKPGMDDGFDLVRLAETTLSVWYAMHAKFDMTKETAAGGHQKAKKVLEFSRRTIVRHDPDTNPWQKRIGWRLKDGSSWRRLRRNSVVACLDQAVFDGVPTSREVGIRVEHYAKHCNLAFFEAYSEAIQKFIDASLWFDFIESANAALAAEVFENILVINPLNQEYLFASHTTSLRCGLGLR
jgi:hypothetical protein